MTGSRDSSRSCGRSRYRLPEAYQGTAATASISTGGRAGSSLSSASKHGHHSGAVATLKVVVDSATVPLVSWPVAERLVRSCKVAAVEQTHRKTVTLTLHTGVEVWTHEPTVR